VHGQAACFPFVEGTLLTEREIFGVKERSFPFLFGFGFS
jgi:hypothetical protein